MRELGHRRVPLLDRVAADHSRRVAARVNAAGLDFYDRLVDELLGNGIAPYATLFHWDTPQVLEDAGGWPERDTVDAFAEYVEAVAERLGDRVGHWITHNEPWVVSWVGHGWGHHAPGRTSDADALATAHHLLALARPRRRDPARGVAGLAGRDHAQPRQPVSRRARRKRTRRPSAGSTACTTAGSSTRCSAARTRPTCSRRGSRSCRRSPTAISRRSRRRSTSSAINNYTSPLVAADEHGGRSRIVRRNDVDRTDMGWEVVPEGLHDLLVRIHRDYDPPAIYVTENGAAFPDVRGHDGSVQDPKRQSYLQGHIDAAARAIAEGVPLRGYFAWSLLDNFEWAWGYWKRFGLIYIDYATLERVPKGSFYWYRDFIAAPARTRDRLGGGGVTRGYSGRSSPGRMR